MERAIKRLQRFPEQKCSGFIEGESRRLPRFPAPPFPEQKCSGFIEGCDAGGEKAELSGFPEQKCSGFIEGISPDSVHAR